MASHIHLTRRTFTAAMLTSALTAKTAGPQLVLAGTYTNNNGSKGIYAFRFDPAKGTLEQTGVAAETTSPSFLTFHPKKPLVYAVNEVSQFQGQPGGAVSVFTLEPKSGKLTELQQIGARGPSPCHLAVHPSGKMLLVANYGGSYISYPLTADGQITGPGTLVAPTGSSVSPRQKGPHPHSADFTADGKYALVNDLGTDKTMVFRVDAGKATLTPAEPAFAAAKPGAGPRHLSIAPDGKHVYVTNELNSTVTPFAWQNGQLTAGTSVSTLPEGYDGSKNTTAEVAVHPSGRFVYVSNRGHDSIAIFARDRASGALTAKGQAVTGGRGPRHFTIAPGGEWLLAANQLSNDIRIFKLDASTGGLTPQGELVSLPAPVCLQFVP